MSAPGVEPSRDWSSHEPWAETDLTPYREFLRQQISAASLKIRDSHACPACGHVPQSWRNPQPRVPRIVTQRGQERPGTESADESPTETGEQP